MKFNITLFVIFFMAPLCAMELYKDTKGAQPTTFEGKAALYNNSTWRLEVTYLKATDKSSAKQEIKKIVEPQETRILGDIDKISDIKIAPYGKLYGHLTTGYTNVDLRKIYWDMDRKHNIVIEVTVDKVFGKEMGNFKIEFITTSDLWGAYYLPSLPKEVKYAFPSVIQAEKENTPIEPRHVLGLSPNPNEFSIRDAEQELRNRWRAPNYRERDKQFAGKIAETITAAMGALQSKNNAEYLKKMRSNLAVTK